MQRRACIGGQDEGRPCNSAAQCDAGSSCWTLFDFSDRLHSERGLDPPQRVGPVLITSGFTADIEDHADLDGLIETPSMFVFVSSEAIGREDDCDGDGTPDCTRLNADSDGKDDVLRLRSRTSGNPLPIGASGSDGRAVSRVRDRAFRFPAVAVENDLVAFLEPEPLEGDACGASQGSNLACDTNGNREVADTILRLYRVDAISATPLGSGTTASAAPLINGRSVAISGAKVFFRTSEAGENLQVTTWASPTSDPIALSRATPQGVIAAGGGHVAMSSQGPLVPGAPDDDSSDVNGRTDVYVHDRAPEAPLPMVRASVDSNGIGGAKETTSHTPSISPDGRFVAFDSDANLDPAFDAGGFRQIWIRELRTGLTELVSQGRDANGDPVAGDDHSGLHPAQIWGGNPSVSRRRSLRRLPESRDEPLELPARVRTSGLRA